ncbi:DegV domain-containing protein [Carbonactinospora thermoautotrophica]|uniref:DegV domain-containing protein n=2 Tax=Carbonactinospora thermoautotrophica TaxID=1469144 RepID=A0A132MQT4_9ACTN|nr:DegV family protein [Carbonactinospora thermoautotrophica]KWX00090.1 DegV domain-containing protein [Carbonactinospora thermoautotrophica]KWX01966.1 uncharacterized protein LI90_3001 [Carbonactinospora thermoautotrophica]
MRQRVAIVTDSTACLPQEFAARLGVTVVPLKVQIGERSLDEDRVTPGAVAAALREKARVATSQPPPSAFFGAYRQAVAAGAGAIVSIHLSGELSGTCDSARLAAEQVEVPVRVIDSRLVGMGLGYAVMTAAEAARAGAGLDDVVAAAERRCRVTTGYFYVDTLEYLRCGGRIGAAQAFLGSALAIKPLLHLVDGRIQPLEKVRTATRAICRLEEIVVEQAGDRPVDLAVHHLAAPERAAALAARLRARIPAVGEAYVAEVGAVIGAHVGPGLLAVVLAPR